LKKEIKERIQKINNGIVPQGYKRTKMGIIPEDWEVKELEKLGKFKKGKGISKSEVKDEGIKCIRYGEIYTDYNFFFDETISFINEESTKKAEEIKNGDILFSGSGETLEDIGKCVAYIGNEPCYSGGDIVIFSPNNKIDSTLYSYILNANSVNKQKYKYGQGQSIIHLYSSSLKKIIVPFIQHKEQTQIANILSTWDKAIELKEKQLEKKKEIKKGLMQKLLTGEIRLEGFDGEWEETKLKNLENKGYIKLGRGNVISKKHIEENFGKYPVYSSSVNNKGLIGRQDDYMFNQEMITWSIDGGGDFFYRHKHKFSVTNVCGFMKVDINKINYKFIGSQLQLLHKRKSFNYTRKAHPSVIRNLYTLKLPQLQEQKAIAEILSTQDKSIELLEKQIEKLKEQKKGLMQLLLTGKIRVNEIEKVS
jgi:type I restriction enzyme S subunit